MAAPRAKDVDPGELMRQLSRTLESTASASIASSEAIGQYQRQTIEALREGDRRAAELRDDYERRIAAAYAEIDRLRDRVRMLEDRNYDREDAALLRDAKISLAKEKLRLESAEAAELLGLVGSGISAVSELSKSIKGRFLSDALSDEDLAALAARCPEVLTKLENAAKT